MCDPLDPLARDPLEAALALGCETLVELELIQTIAGDHCDLKKHAELAISSLRRALALLRRDIAAAQSALTYGFVVDAQSETGDDARE
jgi:hypothetical protein